MSGLRTSVVSARLRLLFPVLSRLDGTDARIDALEARIIHLTTLLEDMSADADRTAARAAGLVEASGEASRTQLDRRRSELETLLGSAG